MISFRPTAVQGSPFTGHRTVAEIEAAFDEAERRERMNSRVAAGVEPVLAIVVRGQRSNLPPDPCFRCGGRGWCGHNGRVAQ